MLISKDLDDQTFAQIFQKAQKQISLLTSDWTNYNPSDPGITLLELFSWYKEVQQYHLNAMGREHELAYLKLLGARPRAMQPAQVRLFLDGVGDVPAGSVFLAEGIPFETTVSLCAADSRLIGLGRNGRMELDLRKVRSTGGKLAFHPYLLREGPDGQSFTLYFDRPLPDGVALQLWFELEGEDGRQPEDGFVPYVTIGCEYWDGAAYAAVTVLEDQTRSFFRSGLFRFQLPQGAGMVAEEDGYPLRFTVREGAYLEPPVVRDLWFNTVQAVQKETFSQLRRYPCEQGEVVLRRDRLLQTERLALYGVDGERRVPLEWEAVDGVRVRLHTRVFSQVEAVTWQPRAEELRRLGTATGVADLRVPLMQDGVLPDSLALLVKEADGNWYRWDRAEDLYEAGPDERVYRFDADTGALCFGDDEHGMAPEGELLLVSWSVSRGKEGNIQGGTLVPPPDSGLQRALCLSPARGGSEPESPEACFRRVRQELRAVKRCVTLGDFEEMARSVPGIGLKRVRAFTRDDAPNQVFLAVEIAGGHTALSAGVEENLRRAILPHVMLNTKVQFLMPVYVQIKVYAQVSVSPQFSVHQQDLRQAFVRYFEDPSMGFGATLSKNDLLDYLHALPQIRSVDVLELSFSGGNATARGGDILLGKACLPKLGQLDLSIQIRDDNSAWR